MLREPRSRLAKAELRSIPLAGPLNALLVLGLGLLGTCRLAIRSVSPLMRFCGLFEGALALRSLSAGFCLSLFGS